MPFSAMMQARPDLRDDLARQEAAGTSGLIRRDIVRDPVQERASEHIAGSRQILGLARDCCHVRFHAAVPYEGAARAIGYDERRDHALERLECGLGRASFRKSARLTAVGE